MNRFLSLLFVFLMQILWKLYKGLFCVLCVCICVRQRARFHTSLSCCSQHFSTSLSCLCCRASFHFCSPCLLSFPSSLMAPKILNKIEQISYYWTVIAFNYITRLTVALHIYVSSWDLSCEVMLPYQHQRICRLWCHVQHKQDVLHIFC